MTFARLPAAGLIAGARRPATRPDHAARIGGVLLDKDGTLFDVQATWGAWSRSLIGDLAGGDPALAARIADVFGYDPTAQRFRSDSIALTEPTAVLAERLLFVLPETTAAGLAAFMDARAATAPQVEAAPLGPLMARLAGMGLALGVATNDADASARAHLRAAGVEDAFGFIAGCDSGWGAKPEAGQLRAFAAAAGLDPADCVMVGDSLHDLHAARAAGMVGVGVLTGLADRATLAPAAVAVLRSIAELPDWIAARDGR